MKPFRVILVDDHPMFREGVKSRLAEETGIAIVGEAEDGETAIQLVENLKPQVMVLDIGLKGALSGVDVARTIQARELPVNILVLSAYESSSFILNVLDAGVSGYLLKKEPPEEIVKGILGVAEGEENWFSREVAGILSRRHRNRSKGLSEREEQVLRHVASGYTNDQIATRLNIKANTVKNHITKIFDKIGVSNRSSAANWAWMNGYETP